MNKKYFRDLIAMVVFAVLSIIMIVWGIPSQVDIAKWNTGSNYTARTFPYLIMYIVLASSVIGVINYSVKFFLASKNEAKKKECVNTFYWKPVIRTTCVIIITILYYFAFCRIGFLLSTAIMIPIILIVLSNKKWIYAIYLYAFSFLIFIIFRFILLIQIP